MNGLRLEYELIPVSNTTEYATKHAYTEGGVEGRGALRDKSTKW